MQNPPFFDKILRHLPRPLVCVACKLPTHSTICHSCRNALIWNRHLLPAPTPEYEGVAPLLYSFERTQSLIRRWKERGGSDLRKNLFRMPESLKKSLLELHFFAIVPIPQDRGRSFSRGHFSALEVAKFFSSELDLPLHPLLSLQTKPSKRQTGLHRFDRAFSRNPFEINPDIFGISPLQIEIQSRVDQGKEIRFLVVDDLITSGSTLSKGAALIKDYLPRSRLWAGSLGFRPKPNLRDLN